MNALLQSIPPGVLHLCRVMVALRKRLVDDDDDDDTAPEVQTNFISSQNFTMIVYFVISRMLRLPFLLVRTFVCWFRHARSIV